MNKVLINSLNDIIKTVDLLGLKIEQIVNKKGGICTDKKITKKTKNCTAYILTSGAYDTETTTIKHKEIRIGNEYYIYNEKNNTYLFNHKNNLYENKVDEDEKTNIFERPDYAFVYHVQMIIADTYIVIRHFEYVKHFFEQLAEKIKSLTQNYEYFNVTGFPKLLIWIANLNFEWSFLKGILNAGSVTNQFSKNATTPLKIEIENVIELRECLGLWGNSLAKIAKDYTKTQKLKGDLDYDLIRTEKTPLTEQEEKYCYNDVKILEELSYIAFEKYTKHHLRIPYTSTGIVRQMCKKSIKNINAIYNDNLQLMPYNECEKDDEKTLKKAENLYFEWRNYLYQGGLAHSNSYYVGKTLNNVVCADITSDYPYQMNSKYYPSGRIVHETDTETVKDIVKKTNKCFIARVKLYNVESKTSHTLISRNKVLNINDVDDCVWDNGRLYRGNNIELWINEVDLCNIQSMYSAELEILDFWYFTQRRSVPKYILDTMNELYKKKNELKQNGLTETLEYKESKARVNSIYGMTGTRLYNRICELDDNCNIVQVDDKDFSYYESIRKMVYNPYIAYWTTSYARAIIVHYISLFPHLIVQYDTDSIYYIKDTELVDSKEVELLEREITKHNNNVITSNKLQHNSEYMHDLGTWDIEKPYKQFKCLGAKRYVCEKQDGTLKPVIAGCPKTAFIEYINNKKVNPFDFFSDGMLLTPMYSKKMTASYRHDKTPVNVTIVDYLGNVCDVTYRTYCALYSIPFKLTMCNAWLENLVDIIEGDKKLPEEYRRFKYLETYLYQNKKVKVG